MVRLRFHGGACLVLVALVTGCTGMSLRRLEPPVAVKPDEIVWIWSGANLRQWHAVAITQDSVLGIPYQLPVSCDSCRLSLPRSQVDSLKVRDKGGQYAGATRSPHPLELVGVVVAAILVEAGVCALIHAGGQC
jgi:hypothetical protein